MANNVLFGSDNFASGSLAPQWTLSLGSGLSLASVVSNGSGGFVAEPSSTSAVVGQQWNATTPNDQICELTVFTLVENTSTSMALGVRLQTASASGYFVNVVGNGTNFGVFLYREDSGSFTQLATTTITVASGDVLSFSAVGSMLVFYQNYNQVLRWADATYTSGQCGVRMTAALNNIQSQIGSFRGYSVVQQDGIWQKQGILAGLAPLSGDIASGGGGIANATMLHEGNAQILSGTVYKMWFSAGAPGAESNIYYAESTDGINWTRDGSVIIASFGSPFVIKNGATYYLYAQPSANAGKGDFSVYTSPDGINWTSQATNILGALGGVGVWDGVTQWYFQPVSIIGGTWTAIYSGGNNSSTKQLSIGVATSADGITWSKFASNPVLQGAQSSSVVNNGAISKIGGTYWCWFFGMQPGQGTAFPNLDPGEGVRYSTPDFKNWTFQGNSIHRAQTYEGVNFGGGQSFPNSIFTVGSRTFMYVQAAVSDIGPQGQYQMTLAIANATIPQIVTKREDGMQQTASDGFTRASGGLGANWTTPTGGSPATIASSGVVQPSVAATAAYEAYTAGSFGANQYSEIKLQTLSSSSNDALPAVRMSTSALTGYFANIAGALGSASTAAIFVAVAGVFTQIGPTATVTPSQNDVFRLSIVGNVLSLFQNGFLILQVNDVNNTIASGFPGFRLASDNVSAADAQISLFAAGNAGVIPSYAKAGRGTRSK